MKNLQKVQELLPKVDALRCNWQSAQTEAEVKKTVFRCLNPQWKQLKELEQELDCWLISAREVVTNKSNETQLEVCNVASL